LRKSGEVISRYTLAAFALEKRRKHAKNAAVIIFTDFIKFIFISGRSGDQDINKVLQA